MGTVALVAVLLVGLAAWWWTLGDPPQSPAPASPPPTAKQAPPAKRAAPPAASVTRAPAPLGDDHRESWDDLATEFSTTLEHPLRCRLEQAEAVVTVGTVSRTQSRRPTFYGSGTALLPGAAAAFGDELVLDLKRYPKPGPAWLDLDDGRSVRFEIAGDPLRCEPDPLVIPDAPARVTIRLRIANAGEAGQTEADGCGTTGRSDKDGTIELTVTTAQLEEGCAVTVARDDGLLNVPGAEIELGLDDADGTIAVELPEWRTGGLGVVIVPGPDGVGLDGVTPGSPAEKAGLRAGDVLLSADGQPLPEDIDAVRGMLTGREGSDVEIEYERDGVIGTVRVTRAVITQ